MAGRLRRLAVALLMVSLLAVGAFGFAWTKQKTAEAERDRAEQQTQLSFSRELAAAAMNNLDRDPERSVLLALHAASVTYSVNQSVTPEAEDALHHAVQASRVRLTLAGHTDTVWGVAFSPDGTRLASGSGSQGQADSGELFVWDAHSGERNPAWGAGNSAFVRHPGVVSALTWAPSGELVVSGGSDGRLRWWEVQSGECMRVQEAHQGMVQSLKVSPDGSTLASCGDDGAILLWDLESGEQLQTLRRDRPYERLNITGIRGLTGAQRATLRALGAVEDGTGARL